METDPLRHLSLFAIKNTTSAKSSLADASAYDLRPDSSATTIEFPQSPVWAISRALWGAGSVATRWKSSPARIAIWVVPFCLTAALILYFSVSHSSSGVTPVGGHQVSGPRSPDLAPDSVAVLPFINEGGDARSDYISDGITESLIGNLAHIPQIRVRSRDAVFRLRGKGIEVSEAGSELGVSIVVSGRVAVDGNHIKVSAELTKVRDNTAI